MVENVKTILQNVVSELYASEKYFEAYLLKAQKLGLQGEKRRLRYESTKMHNLINFIKCDFYDLFGESLDIAHSEIPVQPVSGVEDFFKKCLTHFWKGFQSLHSAGNALVTSNARNYALKIYDICDHWACYVKELRRIIDEGVESGWSDAHLQRLMIQQTTWENVHDRFEDKEKSHGYNY